MTSQESEFVIGAWVCPRTNRFGEPAGNEYEPLGKHYVRESPESQPKKQRVQTLPRAFIRTRLISVMDLDAVVRSFPGSVFITAGLPRQPDSMLAVTTAKGRKRGCHGIT